MAEPLDLAGTDLTMDDFYLCEKHDRWCMKGYPCPEGEREWREAHPERAQAIADFVAGKMSQARLRKVLSRTDN